jgi:hypothetical protein
MADVKDAFGKETINKKDNTGRMDELLKEAPKDSMKSSIKDVNNNNTTPDKPKKGLFKQILSDVNTAIKGNQFGMGGAAMSGAMPKMQQVIEDNKVLDEQKEATGTRGSLVGAAVHPEEVAQNLADRDIAVKEEYKEKHPEVFGGDLQIGDKSNIGEKQNEPANTTRSANDSNNSVPENGLNPREQKAKDSAMKQWQIAQEVLDEQNPYKSGADYLQALWGKGAKGKAQAVANVLGNLLGAVGKGAAGQDYTSDWQKFRDEYTAQSQARRAEAAQNAQNMVNTAAQNDEARMELVNALNQAKAQGANITEKDLAAINAWQTATTPSSALNKAIAALVNKVSQEGLLPAAGSILTGIGGKK